MGHITGLKASDGHALDAYLAEPSARPRGGVVVIQEVFGVTSHIRAVADQYAAAGYLAVAPALFDRIERDVNVSYTDSGTAMGYVKKLDYGDVMRDVQAAIDRVARAGKVGIVGYCWGGQLAYLADARLNIAAAIAYYGGGIQNFLQEKPRAPIMFHYGEKDTHIPLNVVEQVKAALPQGVFHLYPAEHGFNCTDRASYEPACAKLAFDRSVEFFHQYVG